MSTVLHRFIHGFRALSSCLDLGVDMIVQGRRAWEFAGSEIAWSALRNDSIVSGWHLSLTHPTLSNPTNPGSKAAETEFHERFGQVGTTNSED